MTDGAADAGADVLQLGLIGTEMLYFAVGDLGLDGGVAVTASHNPKEYTGLKIVRRGALPVGGESGLLDIRDRAVEIKGRLTQANAAASSRTTSGLAYVDRVLSFVDVQSIKPLRVVIDAANGMAGAMLPRVLDRLPIDAIRFFFEPDGSFPNHPPNPLLPENREFIVAKTLEEGADLGAAFDGDADRCFFVDDTGEFVPGDFVTALLAASLLEKEPGAKIIYDLRASWAVPETIELRRRRAADQPGRPRVHQAADARRRRCLRRRGLWALLLPRLLAGGLGGRSLPPDARAGLEGGPQAVGDPRRLSQSLLPDRRAQHGGRRRGGKLQELEQRFGSEGEVSHLDGLSDRRGRLADERAAVEHGTPATAESRGTDARADGAQARRSAGGHRLVNIELGHATARKPPFKYAAFTRVGFSDTDAQGIVYYGRYLPYFDQARVEYHRHLDLLGEAMGEEQFVMRASSVEYFAPARFDDLIEIFIRMRKIGRTSATYECAAYRVEDDVLMVTATQTLVLVDLAERRARTIPGWYRDAIRGFEDGDCEIAAA